MRFVFKIVHKCSKCKKDYKLGDFRSGSKILNQCLKCRNSSKKSLNKQKCIHNKQKCRCRECGGSSICIHNKRKNECVDCSGSYICIHNKKKNQCGDCGGSSICIHNRHKSHCKECSNPIHITIKNMIGCSKHSDKKCNRYDEINFIDYEYLKNLIDNNDKCYYCSCELQYTYYTNNLATIERLDNSLGHIKSNCVIACRTCNYTKVGSRVQSL